MAVADALALDVGLGLDNAWLQITGVEAGEYRAGFDAIAVAHLEFEDATADRCRGAHPVRRFHPPVEHQGRLDGFGCCRHGLHAPYAFARLDRGRRWAGGAQKDESRNRDGQDQQG